jgi:hypothetical protein
LAAVTVSFSAFTLAIVNRFENWMNWGSV